MEMESTRRSFDRSREQIKKPRLSADDQTNPNGRAFAPRPAPTAASAARFREIEGGYQPQALGQAQQQYQELVSQYKLAIGELTFNSKPIITNLTIIAGENLHAAKAIAAIVCNNIIEVPSDQKLPSLYLLDSIVKNIGKDYIKHFATRLPEVFCKAYRQVDPPVHQSMRHLFGTWKGVFPSQCLQTIERELGFSAAVNGSSSGGVASRPDSQSQRAHSIHVNPKYLERQRIQQSTRGKTTASDTNVSTANSVEDVERPDRAVSDGVGRSWVDPLVKMQSIQPPQRGALHEPVHGKKKVGAALGDFEYGSDVSRDTGIGRTSGRVTEQGLDKSWYGAGSRDPETLSTQRNGFNMKHGLPDYLALKPANLPPTHSNARSGSGMSPSWKNSEEEEFMWETHSRLSDQDAANLSSNVRKDLWTPDDSDKMEFSLAEVGPRFDRETSTDSLSTEQKEYPTLGRRLSSPWKLQELHPTDGSSINAVPSEGYLATIGGLATSASSSARLAVRGRTSPNVSSGPTGTLVQQKFPSAGMVSQSGQSPMHQHPPSPSSSIPSRLPHPKLQNSAEQEYSQTHSLSQPAYKASRYLESLLPSTAQSGNLSKFQPENLQPASSIMPTFQPARQFPSRLPDSKETEPSRQTAKPWLPHFSRTPQSGTAASGNSDPLIAEPLEQSSTSSLLASVMKTGILSNIVSSGLPNPSLQDVGSLSSQLSIQTSRPSRPPTSQFPPSGSIALSASLSDSLSLGNSSATNVSQRKQEQPGLPAGTPSSEQNKDAVNKGLNPLSNLLSSLVAKGLISASKSETSSVLPPQIPNPKKKQSPKITNSSSTPPSPKSEKSSPLPPQIQSKKQSPTITNSSSTPPSSKSETSPMPQQNPSKSKAQSPSFMKTKSTQASPVVSEILHKSTSDGISLPEARDKSSQPLSMEIHNLIGLEFKPDLIREIHPPVISALCDDIPHQCSLCGLRLKLTDQLDRHMEWHTWKNGELKGVDKVTRRWYADSMDWIAGREGLPLGLESSSSVDEIGRTMDVDEPVVPADEDQCVCILCGELFEDHYCQQTNKWLFKGAMRLGLTSGIGDVEAINEGVGGPIAHVNCVSDRSVHDLGLASGA